MSSGLRLIRSAVGSNYTSRWRATPEGALVASWAGQSLAFRFHGSQLQLKTGPSTVRKDKDNGDIPTIAINVWKNEHRVGLPPDEVYTHDAFSTETPISVFDESKPVQAILEVVLVDWASEFELSGLLVDEVKP